MSAAEQLAERGLEVLVDLVERFFKFLPRDLIDLADGGRGIFDRIQQIFALGFEELVALRGFLVLFERHHVDRAHGVEAGAHFAVRLIFGGKFVASKHRNRRISHQYRTFHAEFVQAGFGHVLQVGLQLGRRGRSSPRRSRARSSC